MNLPNPNNNNSTVRHTELSALVDILRNVKRLDNNLTNMSSPTSVISILQSIETSIVNSNWAYLSGNSIEYTYYAGVEAGNPSGTTTNVKTAAFKTGVSTIFTQTFAYDANDLVISITTT